MSKTPSTVMDVMRAIAHCGLERREVTEVFVERDRDRHFVVSIVTDRTPAHRALLEKALDFDALAVKSVLIKEDDEAQGYDIDVTLLQPFGEWPLTDVYDLFLRTFRQRTGTRVEPILGGYSEPQPEMFRLLDSIEVVRLRPGMYVGGTESALPLLEKVMQAAITRHIAHPASRIAVTVGKDGKCTVSDDAPGAVLLDEHGRDPETVFGVSSAEGIVVAKALSETLRVESCRGDKVEALAYARGRRVDGDRPGVWTAEGNKVSFEADLDLLDAPLQVGESRELVEWAAMLVPKLELTFNGERICFDSFAPAVRRIARRPLWGGEVFQFAFKAPELELELECALGWRDGDTEVQSFVNYRRVPNEGSLQRGLRTALQQAISLGRENAKVTEPLSRVAAVILARVPKPEFGLRGAYIEPVIEAEITRQLAEPLSVFLDSIDGARERLHVKPSPAGEGAAKRRMRARPKKKR